MSNSIKSGDNVPRVIEFVLFCVMRNRVALKSNFRFAFSLLILAACLAVSGCKKLSQDVETIETASIGGGSGGSGGSGGEGGSGENEDDAEDYTDEFGADYYLGTPSSDGNAVSGLFLGAKRTWAYGAYDSLIDAHAATNTNFTTPIASRDTNARSQWQLGWTGKDVKVGVLDEFNTNEILDTHGDKVSIVVNSVAPEAQLTSYNFTLTQQAAEEAFQNLDAQDVHIINNSWGSARFSHVTGEEDTNFDANVNNWVSLRYKITGTNTYDEKMLFVFSAGNSGTYCPDKRIQECSFYPAVVHRQRALGVQDSEAYIWVGSLNDAGTALADYSHSAGDMGEDFIVAHDDVLSAGDLAGTSFAAPRVSGAAALIRHKFPGLDGFQLKELLLSTAEDIGEPGTDPIYGRGKLDLSNALSPQGQLTASGLTSSITTQSPEKSIPFIFMLPVTTLLEGGAPEDWQLLSLKAESRHTASKVWPGKFTSLNGHSYNVQDFYQSNQPNFSARAIFKKTALSTRANRQVTWLLPIAVDAGYEAKLYQAAPLLSIGFGAAITLAPQSMLSMRIDNALRLGGTISEQPCYDGFRRQYHCGTGMAWIDYRQIDTDRRDGFAEPSLQVKYVERFSF